MGMEIDGRFQPRGGVFLNQLTLETEIGFMAVEQKILLAEQRHSVDPVEFRLRLFDEMVRELRNDFERKIRLEHATAKMNEAVTQILRADIRRSKATGPE